MQIDRRTLVKGATATLAAAAAAPAYGAELPTRPLTGDYASRLATSIGNIDRAANHGPYRPEWESLQYYHMPDWYRDAKFGIFIHWGVYSVPAFANEWYPRNMYVPDSDAYKHHIATYGPQSKFGYKDFIPKFTAEKFDPDAWVDLFARAGARYVVPVGEHCDGFAMYASDLSDWTVAKMGPKRDTLGMIAHAVRARGLKLGVSSHRAEHCWWYTEGTTYDSDINDPRYAGIYGPAQPMTLPADRQTIKGEPNSGHLERWLPPSDEFLNDWLGRSAEIATKYQTDLMYFDWWINQTRFEPYLRRFAAGFYNQAAARRHPGVITYKAEALAPGAGILNIERGMLDSLRLRPWQTETSVSIKSWGYAENDSYRTAESLLCDFVDVVSKNGNFLLNVGPKSDGTIPPEASNVLLQIGDWLRTNGEAIYGSRPWVMFGEGNTNTGATEKKERVNRTFTAEDIRFTTKGATLYAIGLADPVEGKALIKTLYKGTPYLTRAIAKIDLLGSNKPVTWQQTNTGLAITLPEHVALPYVMRITMA